jgi:hypothetical protein
MTPVANSARASHGLTAKFSNAGLTRSTGTIGGAVTGFPEDSKPYPLADVGHSFQVTSGATGNVATLTLASGAVAQTTGTPTITEGDGKDWEGITLPTMAKLMSIRLRAKDANTGTITLTPSSTFLPEVVLKPGMDLLFSCKAAGEAFSGQTLAMTFSASGDSLEVDILGADS